MTHVTPFVLTSSTISRMVSQSGSLWSGLVALSEWDRIHNSHYPTVIRVHHRDRGCVLKKVTIKTVPLTVEERFMHTTHQIDS